MSPPLLTVLRALSFGQDRRSDLRSIPAAEWRRLLALTDRSQLTLPLAVRCRHELPAWVQERLAGNLKNNRIRHDRILDAYQEVAGALSSKGVDFVILKGLAQWPHYCDDLRHRPQYDLDLYCPPDAIESALETIQSLGYEPFGRKRKDRERSPTAADPNDRLASQRRLLRPGNAADYRTPLSILG